MKVGNLYRWNMEATAPVVVNQGGTSSGKTYSILQVLFTLAAQNENWIITVVGQDVPNLKSGAIRDSKNILSSNPAWMAIFGRFNESDKFFRCEKTGSVIEFKSYENAQDAKSGKRNILFVNEANGIDYDIYFELQLRTSERTYIDYNPNAEFWAHEKLIGRDGVQLFISTFEDNPFLAPQIKQKILSLRDADSELWRVYGEGLTGKIQGLIFKNIRRVNDFPDDVKKLGFGLDFGFTNDPTGLVMMGELHGELWGKELIYQTGMTNSDISNEMKSLGMNRNHLIVADSAEPKSIEELKRMGWNVVAAKKGADSIRHGIEILQRYPAINITADSVNWHKEAKSYKWREVHGVVTNVPIDKYNHLADCSRYYAQQFLAVSNQKTPGRYFIEKM